MVVLPACLPCRAQATRSFRGQSSSSFAVSGPRGSETVEITNITYEVTGNLIPGRPKEQRLLLRKTVRSKQVLDEIGVEASATLEAWPFQSDLSQKPIYSLMVPGTDARTVDGALFEVSRGLEEVEWWSVYKLGSAEHLFDTYVPLVSFSISRKILTQRYAGLAAPGDDDKDTRLKQPNVVAVLTYASAERVIREALITCDDAHQAAVLRSYADTTRTLSLVEVPATSPRNEPRRALKISLSQNYPSAPATLTFQVPVAGDELDLEHVQLPARLHMAAWKR